jgi:hypothetical protein
MKSASMFHSSNNMQMTILLFGIFEILIGFSGAVLADFFSVFGLLTILSGFSGLVALIFCVFNFNKIKLYDLMAMAIVFGYGGGALNTLISFTLDGLDILKIAYVEEYWLSLTLGLVTASAGVLHVIGRFHNASALLKNFEVSADQKYLALLLISLVFALTLSMYINGEIGFMRDTRIHGLVNVSIKATLIDILILPVSALTLFLSLKEESKMLKYTLMLISAVFLLITFGFGRRIFAISVLIYMMIFFSKNDKKKLSLKNLVVLVFTIILVQVAATSFSLMRIAKYSLQDTSKNVSIVELIPKTLDTYFDSERLNTEEVIHKNVTTRTFVLNYLALLVKASSKFEPLYGENFLRALTFATPGILYPEKYQTIFINEESLLTKQLRLRFFKDEAGSIFTGGVGDFGIYGLFAYPLILCLVFTTFLNTISRLFNPASYFLVSMTACYCIISIEQDLSSYLNVIRNILIILFILWLFFNFNRILPFTNDVKNNPNIMNMKSTPSE